MASTGEILSDKNQQMERWVEHYSDLNSTQYTITDEALDAMECQPTINELNAEPTANNFAYGKTCGTDGAPLNLIKQCQSSLLLPLRASAWKKGES